jgi:hypothetical protein
MVASFGLYGGSGMTVLPRLPWFVAADMSALAAIAWPASARTAIVRRAITLLDFVC